MGEEEGVDAVVVGIGLVNKVIPVSCETVDSIKGGKVDRIVVAVVGTVVGMGDTTQLLFVSIEI